MTDFNFQVRVDTAKAVKDIKNLEEQVVSLSKKSNTAVGVRLKLDIKTLRKEISELNLSSKLKLKIDKANIFSQLKELQLSKKVQLKADVAGISKDLQSVKFKELKVKLNPIIDRRSYGKNLPEVSTKINAIFKADTTKIKEVAAKLNLYVKADLLINYEKVKDRLDRTYLSAKLNLKVNTDEVKQSLRDIEKNGEKITNKKDLFANNLNNLRDRQKGKEPTLDEKKPFSVKASAFFDRGQVAKALQNSSRNLRVNIREEKLKVKVDSAAIKNQVSNALRSGSSGVNIGGGLIAGAASAGSLSQVFKLGDTYTNLGNQVKLITRDFVEQEELTRRLKDIAQETRSSYEATFKLFQRSNIGFGQTGSSLAEQLEFARTLNQLAKISGRDTEETNAALYQFTQNLGVGVLRGEELRSVLEQFPLLAEKIVEEYNRVNGTNFGTGSAKALAEKNLLGIDLIKNALRNSAPEVAALFAELGLKSEDFVTVAGNTITNSLGKIFSEITNSPLAKDLFKTITDDAEEFDEVIANVSFTALTLGAVAFGRALTGALLANPLLATAAAVTYLGVSFLRTNGYFETTRNEFTALTSESTKLSSAFTNLGKEQSTIAGTVGDVSSALVTSFGIAFDSITNGFEDTNSTADLVFDSISQAGAFVSNKLGVDFSSVTGVISGAFASMGEFVSGILGGIGDSIRGNVEALNEFQRLQDNVQQGTNTDIEIDERGSVFIKNQSTGRRLEVENEEQSNRLVEIEDRLNSSDIRDDLKAQGFTNEKLLAKINSLEDAQRIVAENNIKGGDRDALITATGRVVDVFKNQANEIAEQVEARKDEDARLAKAVKDSGLLEAQKKKFAEDAPQRQVIIDKLEVAREKALKGGNTSLANRISEKITETKTFDPKKVELDDPLAKAQEKKDVARNPGTVGAAGPTFEELSANLERESTLLKKSAAERERLQAIYQAEDTLKRQLTETELALFNGQLKTNQALQRQGDIKNSFRDVENDYRDNMEALNIVYKDGDISLGEYNQKVKEFKQSLASINPLLQAELDILEDIKRPTEDYNVGLAATNNLFFRGEISAKQFNDRIILLKENLASTSPVLAKQIDILSKYDESQKDFNDTLEATQELSAKVNKRINDLKAKPGNNDAEISEINRLRTLQRDLVSEQRQATIAFLETQDDAVSGVSRSLLKLSEGALTTADIIENAFTNSFKTLEDTLTDFLSTGELDFKNFAKTIQNELNRAVIQNTITEPLKRALSKQNKDGSFSVLDGKIETKEATKGAKSIFTADSEGKSTGVDLLGGNVQDFTPPSFEQTVAASTFFSKEETGNFGSAPKANGDLTAPDDKKDSLIEELLGSRSQTPNTGDNGFYDAELRNAVFSGGVLINTKTGEPIKALEEETLKPKVLDAKENKLENPDLKNSTFTGEVKIQNAQNVVTKGDSTVPSTSKSSSKSSSVSSSVGSLAAPLFNAIGLPGFANGGELQLGGNPGRDKNLLQLNGEPIAKVSKGEFLNITPQRFLETNIKDPIIQNTGFARDLFSDGEEPTPQIGGGKEKGEPNEIIGLLSSLALFAGSFTGIFNDLFSSLPKFASGGNITVGANGGVDNNLLSLNGQPIGRVNQGETINIIPNGSKGGASNNPVVQAVDELSGLELRPNSFVGALKQLYEAEPKKALQTGFQGEIIPGRVEAPKQSKLDQFAGYANTAFSLATSFGAFSDLSGSLGPSLGLGGGGAENEVLGTAVEPSKLGIINETSKFRFANGGSFKVAGNNGIDGNTMAINGVDIGRVSRGEVVEVRNTKKEMEKNSQPMYNNVTINVQTQDAESFQRSQSLITQRLGNEINRLSERNK